MGGWVGCEWVGGWVTHQLIEDDETAAGGLAEDEGGVPELDQKGRHACCEVITYVYGWVDGWVGG